MYKNIISSVPISNFNSSVSSDPCLPFHHSQDILKWSHSGHWAEFSRPRRPNSNLVNLRANSEIRVGTHWPLLVISGSERSVENIEVVANSAAFSVSVFFLKTTNMIRDTVLVVLQGHGSIEKVPKFQGVDEEVCEVCRRSVQEVCWSILWVEVRDITVQISSNDGKNSWKAALILQPFGDDWGMWGNCHRIFFPLVTFPSYFRNWKWPGCDSGARRQGRSILCLLEVQELR